MSNIKINAEFELSENLLFDAFNETGEDVGSLSLEKGLIKYTDSEKGETIEFNDDADKFNEFVVERKLHFKKTSLRKWIEYNPNPKGKNVGDCTLRAYCKAVGIDWNKAYDIAAKYGKKASTIMNDNTVVKTIITEEFGFKFEYPKKEQRITVNEFAKTHKTGTYILGVRSHVVAVVNGYYYDSWDSGDKKINRIFTKVEK